MIDPLAPPREVREGRALAWARETYNDPLADATHTVLFATSWRENVVHLWEQLPGMDPDGYSPECWLGTVYRLPNEGVAFPREPLLRWSAQSRPWLGYGPGDKRGCGLRRDIIVRAVALWREVHALPKCREGVCVLFSHGMSYCCLSKRR